MVLAATDLEDTERARTWEALARAALARMGDPDEERADLLDALGYLEALRGNEEQAHAHHVEALTLRYETFGREDPRTATTLRLLANSLGRAGDLAGSLEGYEESLAIVTEIHGPGHPDAAQIDVNIGLTLLMQGHVDAAVERVEQALEVWTRVYGPDSVRITRAEILLAEIAYARGEWARSEELATHAWSIQRRELHVGHSERGMALGVLANAYIRTERYDEALAAHETLLEEFASGPNRNQLFGLELNTGWLLCRLERCTEARPYYERAFIEASNGSRRATMAELGLATVDLADDLPDLALRRLLRLQPAAEAHVEAHPELLAETFFVMARARLAIGRDAEKVLAAAERSRELYEKAGDQEHHVAEVDAFISGLRATERPRRSAG